MYVNVCHIYTARNCFQVLKVNRITMFSFQHLSYSLWADQHKQRSMQEAEFLDFSAMSLSCILNEHKRGQLYFALVVRREKVE